MEVLFLSSLCSKKEYIRMFEKYGTVTSHASQKFNRLLLNGLIANGCSVCTLTQREIHESAKDDLCKQGEIEDEIKYTYLKRYSNYQLNRIYTIFQAAKYILGWVDSHKTGIVICDCICGELSIACRIASRFRNFISTALVTDIPSIRAGDNRKGIRAIPVRIKNALIYSYSSYIFLTEQMNKKLNPHNRPYTIVEGIADEAVLYEPNKLEDKYTEKVIMMAGLLEDIYGVNILIDAFRQITDTNVRLVFYGKGSSVPKIEEAANQDARIEYCGELNNQQIVREEKKATLLINPRPPIGEWTAYSFPSKNMEYMASGTPLLAFDLPCIPEEYQPYYYHLKEYSSESMKEIIEEILSKDKSEIHRFGLAAQQWIVSEKSPEKQLKKVTDILP